MFRTGALAIRNLPQRSKSTSICHIQAHSLRCIALTRKNYSTLPDVSRSVHGDHDAILLQKQAHPQDPPRNSSSLPFQRDQGGPGQIASKPQNSKSKPTRISPQLIRNAAGRRHTDTPSAKNIRRPKDWKDEAYIRRTMHVPTSEDYPDLPEAALRNPKHHLYTVLQGAVKLKATFAHLSHAQGSRCSLSFESASHNIVVDAEGRNKQSAEDAAYLHFAAKCHDQGILTEVFDRNSPTNQINREVAKKEVTARRDAILDIYNYAARYDVVPVIQLQQKTRGGRVLRHVHETTVDLDSQNIHVAGHGSSAQAAVVDAVEKFKVEAERYHADKGEETLVIKDTAALTADSAEKFAEFMKIVRPGIRIETVSKPKGPGFQAQCLINSEPAGVEVQMVNKKQADAAALLTACIALKKDDPTLWPRYLRALQYGNGQILKPIAPIDMQVDEDCSLLMRETLLGARRSGLPDEVRDVAPVDASDESRKNKSFRPSSPLAIANRSEKLKRKLEAFESGPQFDDMRTKKADLPMSQYRHKVLDLVNNNEYSIIVGATGSGKTTQVPQILLEDATSRGEGGNCNVICTQPRRIAATSVARRVADERGESLQDSVGYIVRFDSKPPEPTGAICYCTTGILLQQLQHIPDEVLDGVSHLVIDEVHERDVIIDFLLILLKKNMERRRQLGKKNPRVVLMSATIDTDLFANYFASEHHGDQVSACPTLSVPGRTFPVRERYIDEILKDMVDAKTPLLALQSDLKSVQYLEKEREFQRAQKGAPLRRTSDSIDDQEADRSVIDWQKEKNSLGGQAGQQNERDNALVPAGLVANTIAHILRTTQSGAILAFLPGLDEIVKVDEKLNEIDFGVPLKDETRFKRFMLHSSIASSQSSVFDPVPDGCRKIILATNIAETSVTIPDVQYVVDTGKLREKQYDQSRRITQLACTWVSKSNSKQRAGRAGRVQDGNYFALFSKERYDSLRPIGLPELLRADLQEICLDIKAQAFKTPIREFLADAIEPPSATNVDASVYSLQALDALTDGEEITPLGRLLSTLPIHPSLGKMIVLGIIFRCLDPMLLLGAANAERPIFVTPLGERKESNASKLSYVQGSASDHIALLNAVRELRHWRNTHGDHAMRQYARSHYLHAAAFATIESTAQQIEQLLVESGLIPFTPSSRRQNFQFGDPALNENSHKVPLVKALNLAGLHPNFAVSPFGGMLFRTPGEKNVMVHPSSTNAPRAMKKFEKDERRAPTFYTYSSLARSNDGNSLYLRETTETTPLQACLFGGRLNQNPDRNTIVEIDDWLPFFVHSPDRRTTKTIIEFRKGLERLLMVTFNDLGSVAKQRKQRRMSFDSNETYLADDAVRRSFAAGLVDVLDRDITPGERTRQRGWANQATDRGQGMTRPRTTPAANDDVKNLLDSLSSMG